MNPLKASWKTSAAAIVAALALLMGELSKDLDDDSETKSNWPSVIAEAAGFLWLGFAARDNNVSSEKAGAT